MKHDYRDQPHDSSPATIGLALFWLAFRMYVLPWALGLLAVVLIVWWFISHV